ncbi:MAG: hypothetical protein K6F79_09970 [Saccharofermentans sp.]|nr:hypothetical protein [Saccharofermentans sp.]
MKNNIQLIVTFVLLFSLCSCTNNQSIVESTTAEETVNNSAVETVECSTTTSEEEPTQLPDYSVGMLDISLDFDELLTRYMEMWDIDSEEMESHLADYTSYHGDGFIYIPDYPPYLEDWQRMSWTYDFNGEPIQMFDEPEEYEYHIVRCLSIDDISIDEYENKYWAEVSYRNHFEYRMNNNEIHNTSSVEDGYFFVFDRSCQNSLGFRAYYYVDNYVISYYLNYYMPDGDLYVEEYNRYLDRCEELGLPTCDDMTEIVLG